MKWMAFVFVFFSFAFAEEIEIIHQSIGGYAKGKLVSASALTLDGDGHLKIFSARERHWGAKHLVDLIEEVALSMIEEFPEGERIQIGDLSAKNGGKISRHSSHQNGLDVDIAYLKADYREQGHGEGFDEKFVKKGILSKNFDTERNWAMMKKFVDSGRVGRIFVDQVIKNEFCHYVILNGELEEEAEVLSKLRHWPNHSDHLHLRLNCPQGNPLCKNQPELSSEHGCEKILKKYGVESTPPETKK